ncbi:MAG: Ig-like domain-containing protein [Bacteroidota bacterium]
MQTLTTFPITRWLAALVLALSLAACDSGDSGDGGGGGDADTTAPVLLSADSDDGVTITATFDEALDPTSVTSAAFTVTPGAAVASASGTGTQVTIVLASELSDDERVTYTVTANGVRDAAGNVANGTSAAFPFGGSSGSASQELGAAYPNAGDSRINFFNTDGDRFLLFNPVTGAVSDADDLNDVEDGNLPLGDVGAAASVFGDDETYFFALDGDTYTTYERDKAAFDTESSFEDEFDDFGYDLSGIGAAYGSDGESVILFNRNGTEWQEWFTGSDGFSNVFDFPADFGNGSAPISSVGAAFFQEESGDVYLINRQGTMYTIFTGSGFTAAFPISELGDFEF